MTTVLPLLKRKKAAPTCTLSLTNVSVHRSEIPFPSSNLPEIPTLASTSANSSASLVLLRPRQRTHAALLRRKRCAVLVEPELPSASSSPNPPRKRARKASLSSTPTFYPSPLSRLPIRKSASKRTSIAAALGFGPGPLTGDLRFLCNVYRSIAWARLKRDFTKAEKCLLDGPSMMDVDMDIDVGCAELPSDLDQQEMVFMHRLRSYLIFHEINPQWLDVTPLLSTFTSASNSTSWVDDMEIDDSQDSSSSSSSPPLAHSASPSPPPPPSTPPLLPITPQPRIIASLLFRHRHRVKLNFKARLLAEVAQAEPGRTRRTPRSPLANVVS